MKKLICMLAVFAVLFTACGNDANDNTGDARNGVVQDRDGVIDESGNDNIVDDTMDGARDITDGVADGARGAIDGVENAVDDMTGTNGNNNSRNSMK